MQWQRSAKEKRQLASSANGNSACSLAKMRGNGAAAWHQPAGGSQRQYRRKKPAARNNIFISVRKACGSAAWHQLKLSGGQWHGERARYSRGVCTRQRARSRRASLALARGQRRIGQRRQSGVIGRRIE
jgi:hypothetical protein